MAQPKTEFKSLDKSVRRQMIIDAATEIFHQKGYHQATLDDVAQELGVTKAALYHYFSSKEAILSVIYMQAMENYFARFAGAGQLQERNLSPPEKLRFFIRNHIQQVAVDNLSMLAVFLTEENQLPAEDYRRISQEKRKYNQVVEGIIEEGQAQGFFRPMNARLLANAILGMCNSLYRWYRPGKGGPGAGEVIDLFVALLESGYLEERGAGSTGLARGGGRRKAAREKVAAEEERHARALARIMEEL